MITSYDTVDQSECIRFSRKPVATTKEITNTIFCDLDVHGELVGIEMIDCIPQDLEKMTLNISGSELVVQ